MSGTGRRLLWVTGALFGFGLIMVFSASACRSIDKVNDPYLWISRQLLYSCVALACFTAAFAIDYRRILRWWPWLFAATLVGLILVFVPHVGRPINESARWIRVGGYLCQPSEFAKLTLLVSIAGFLAHRGARIDRFWGTFLPMLVGIGAFSGLIIAEPDLGTGVFVLALGVVLMLVAGIRIAYMAVAAVLAAPALAAVAFWRWAKIMSRLEGLTSDKLPWQVEQSLVALGSGGFWGKGLGRGTQKFGFLPECFTDFIFSIVGEEFGFVGCALVVLAFAVFLAAGLRIALQAPDRGGFLLAFGATFSVVFQAVVNMAVASNAAPTKGISLPFVSYGGSGLALAFAEVGLILNIARATARGSPPQAAGEGRSAVYGVPVRTTPVVEGDGAESDAMLEAHAYTEDGDAAGAREAGEAEAVAGEAVAADVRGEEHCG